MNLILASESPYRKELLGRLNLPFTCSPAHIDEESIWQNDLSPKEVSIELAKMKAQKVFQMNPDGLVIGSDQVIALDGKIFGKPGSIEKATQQLMALRGKTHQLITSVCLISKSNQIVFSNETNLKVKADLTESEIRKYVKQDLPLNCAGSYKIEGMGIALFEKVETTDFTSIIGLPLIELSKQLKKFNVEVFS